MKLDATQPIHFRRETATPRMIKISWRSPLSTTEEENVVTFRETKAPLFGPIYTGSLTKDDARRKK